MNWLDILILAFIVYYMFKGYSNGFAFTIYSLVNIFIKWYLTFALYPFIYQILKSLFEGKLPQGVVKGDIIYIIISFVISYLIITFVINIIFGFINDIMKLPILKSINKLTGFVAGFFLSLFYLTVVFALIRVLNYLIPAGFLKVIDTSNIARLFYYNNLILKSLIETRFI